MMSVAANYFVTVSELTAHNTASAQKDVVVPSLSSMVNTFSPLIPYTPFILVALLFVVAFGILVSNRVRNFKNITTALVFALMVASIPTVITYISQGSRQTAKAGPDEIPRDVRVAADTPSSVLILWRTDATHTGVIRLGAAPLETQTACVYIADNRASVTDHSVRIGELKKGKTYEFEILSGTTWYDNKGSYIRFTVP
jgi:hypothetical protein